MADQTTQPTLEHLKEEISGLKAQLEKMLKNADQKKSEIKDDLLNRLTAELEQLRQNAGERAHQLYQSGQSGAEAVTEKVRENPLASILIAFGAGYAISCILRHLR